MPRIAGDVLDSDTVVKILLGVLLVAVLLWAPNGLASIPFRRLPGVRWLLGLRRPRPRRR
ncbi:MAG: hypothetical protein M5U14_02635 [Acidimicrobiia bacterium]|nr:hypothetical protein [Acidimicrobiia bacterium]